MLNIQLREGGANPTQTLKMAKNKEETIKKICQYVEEGLYLLDAIKMSGISSSTYYRWLDENENFGNKVGVSILSYKQRLIKMVTLHSVKDGRLALEVLKTRWPKEWSQKIQIDGEINHQHKLTIEKAIDLIDGKLDKDTTPELTEGEEKSD